MSDPFDPPMDDLDRRIRAAELPWVQYSRYTLWFVGIWYVLIGVGVGGMMPLIAVVDPEINGDPVGIAIFGTMGVFMFVISAGFGLFNFAGAYGLAAGKKWGWIVALILGCMYIASACMPFGAVLMIGMLNEDVRKLYLDS